ncbi:MAG: methyl-accepting chemotaxis protein, partial [Hyphomicrobiales bacterium]
NRTGEALSEIGHQVIRVSDIIGEIRTASSEQADAVGEINRAVNLLDQSTQQNAAMAEETYSACRSLNGEAESLDSVVGKFTVDSGRMSSVKGELPQSAKAA